MSSQSIDHFFPHDLRPYFLAAFLVFTVSRIKKLSDGLRAVNYIPGWRVPFQPTTIFGLIFPTTWWNPSGWATWKWRSTFYARHGGVDQVSIVPFLFGAPTVYTRNIDVARQIVAGGPKGHIFKPWDAAPALMVGGMNVFIAEGETWRRHRRVVAPAFNNELHRKVWYDSIDLYQQMKSAEGWTSKKSFDVSAIQVITFKFSMIIISKCGFGFPSAWATPTTTDGNMSMQQALRIFTENFLIILFVPRLLQYLPFCKLRETRQASDQLMSFMNAEVAERKAIIRGDSLPSGNDGPGRDIFTMLVKANDGESAKLKLDDKELIGNVYVMLFAGHETTAHTLAATLGNLALHENVQEELYENIVSVIGYDRDPTYEDFPKLIKVLAAFIEAGRLLPPVFAMVRQAVEDTVLQIPNPSDSKVSTPLPVAKGTYFMVDWVGILRNPQYFDEPEIFKPSRWDGIPIDTTAESSFTAFSVGPRACIGRKFASIEAVAFLTILLRDWKVEPLLASGETKEIWKARALTGKIFVALGPDDVPLRFSARKLND